MLLRYSYRLIAPFYDLFVTRATASARRQSLTRLSSENSLSVLINGAGTGLDFPYLPENHKYTALDITSAMLLRSKSKQRKLSVSWVQGDSMDLPFANQSFDVVVLHLILAVVPDSESCLREAARVLKPGGRILVFDKFLQRQERAWLRRLLGLLTAKFVTKMNVVFEEVLETVPELKVESDRPVMAGGWFRLIEIKL